jgi:hypothetical protein
MHLNIHDTRVILTNNNGPPYVLQDINILTGQIREISLTGYEEAEMTENALSKDYAVWSSYYGGNGKEIAYFDFERNREIETGIEGRYPRVFNDTIVYMDNIGGEYFYTHINQPQPPPNVPVAPPLLLTGLLGLLGYIETKRKEKL